MNDHADERTDVLQYDEWATALEDGDLLGQRCSACGHETAAPKAACGRCGSRSLETISLPTAGEVYSVTRIAVAPEGFDRDDGDYRVALIDLDGAKVLARLEGEAEIGDEVTFQGALEAVDEPAPVFG